MRPAHSIRRKLAAAILAGLAALASPGSARAAFTSVAIENNGTSTEGIGTFSGTVSVNTISKTSATVTISLTNTNTVDTGGFITGFAFNLPFGVTSAGMTSAQPDTFTQVGGGAPNTLGNYDDVSGSPYGYFDVGAALGGDLQGGGDPKDGIGAGQTGTFTFSLSSEKGGYNLNTLTATALMSLLSDDTQGGAGEGIQAFLVRFRGFANGDSDKVVGGIICDVPPPTPGAVPAPPALLLGLIGAGGLFFGRGFRRKVAKPATA